MERGKQRGSPEPGSPDGASQRLGSDGDQFFAIFLASPVVRDERADDLMHGRVVDDRGAFDSRLVNFLQEIQIVGCQYAAFRHRSKWHCSPPM